MRQRECLALGFFLFFSPGILLSEQTTEKYGTGSNALLNLYQKYVSPAKGGNTCPMYPSCSQYAKLAIEKKPAIGIIQTCDRLTRCGMDGNSYEIHKESGNLYDPVSGSDNKNYSAGPGTLEVEKIVGIQCSSRLVDTITITQFMLLNRRFDDALRESYIALYESYRNAGFEKNLIQTGCLHLINNDFDGFISLYAVFSGQKELSPECRVEFDILLSKCFYLSGEYNKSLSALSGIEVKNLSEPLKDEIYFVSAMNYLFEGNREKIKYSAGEISANSGRFPFAKKCLAIDSLLPSTSFRKPIVAGTLSAFLPGSGYAYSNRKGTALVAAVVNGLFIWVAAESFTKKNYAVGAAASLIECGWYFGNIYGSAKSAYEYNNSLKKTFIRRSIIDQ